MPHRSWWWHRRTRARELEVALAVGQGLTNADLAATLFMQKAQPVKAESARFSGGRCQERPTAKAHVSRLLTELGLENRVRVAPLVHNAEVE